MTTPRRRRLWDDQFITEAGGPADEDEHVLIDTQDEENKGKTLVRMIIDLSVAAVPFVAGSNETMAVGMGIGLVSAETPVGTINPLVLSSVPQSGWLWRTRFTIGERGTSDGQFREIHADIRSQRKLMYGEPRLFIAYSLDQGDGFIVGTTGIIRSLFLLP